MCKLWIKSVITADKLVVSLSILVRTLNLMRKSCMCVYLCATETGNARQNYYVIICIVFKLTSKKDLSSVFFGGPGAGAAD